MQRPRWLSNWLERHQHPASLALHVLGIPATIAFIPLAAVQLAAGAWSLWWRPAALLLGGYALQWLGHCIEGNDMGEVILVKKWLGRPYVAVAPRYRRPPQ
ncbi:MAG: Mpo1-like protein [Phycisphaerae bacterium]